MLYIITNVPLWRALSFPHRGNPHHRSEGTSHGHDQGGLYSTGTRPTIRTHTCRSGFGRQEGPAPGPSGGHPAHRSGNPGEEVPTGGTGPGKLPSCWASASRQMLDETLEGLDALFKKNGGTPVGGRGYLAQRSHHTGGEQARKLGAVRGIIPADCGS